MARKTSVLLLAVTLALAACGVDGSEGRRQRRTDPDAPLLQIRSEEGFVPVEWALGRGPTFTLLAGGALIHTGPTVATYPGPLLPNYLVGNIAEEHMAQILDLVEAIGLPDMRDERDEENGLNVADATTEVVTYWDDGGAHTYSVYALGIEPAPKNPSTAAFLELSGLMAEIVSTIEASTYDGETVRVIAGANSVSPEFTDIRDWPLDDTYLSDWTVLPNQWICQVYSPEILDEFADATQVTRWTHPDPMMDSPVFTLLVRPLHPGEASCPDDH